MIGQERDHKRKWQSLYFSTCSSTCFLALQIRDPVFLLCTWSCKLWSSSYRLETQRICLQCGRPWFDSWVRKIPWRKAWRPTPVFLPGKSHGQRGLVGYSAWGHRESGRTELVTLTLSREQLGRTHPGLFPFPPSDLLPAPPWQTLGAESLGAAVPWDHVLRAIRQAREGSGASWQ